jgi:Cgr1 family
MSITLSAAVQAESIVLPQGMRKNGRDSQGYPMCILMVLTGKQWHAPRNAFRPKAGNSTYEKRAEERKAMAAVKAKENEMKGEKEAERQV